MAKVSGQGSFGKDLPNGVRATRDAAFDLIATPVFLISIDQVGRPVFRGVNAAHSMISGLTREDVAGRTALELFGERAGGIAYERHCAALYSDDPVSYPITLPSPAGPRHFVTTLTHELNEAGAVVGLVGTMVDMTPLAHAQEQEVARAAELLRRARGLSRMLAVATRDLKSATRAIGAAATDLRLGFIDLGDGKLAKVAGLETAAARAVAALEEIELDGLGEREGAAFRLFSLQILCENLVLSIDPEGKHSVSLPDAAPFGDEVVLRIVLRRLIQRAIDHVGPDGGSLEIALDEAAHGRMRFVVKAAAGPFRPDIAAATLEEVEEILVARGGLMAPPNPSGVRLVFSLPGALAADLDAATEAPVRHAG